MFKPATAKQVYKTGAVWTIHSEIPWPQLKNHILILN